MTKPKPEPIYAVLNACRQVSRLPDGNPIPEGLKHTLLVLATHYPEIRPTQKQLAAEIGVHVRNVSRRMAELERHGLISRTPGRSHKATFYGLKLRAIRECGQPLSDDYGADVLSPPPTDDYVPDW